MSLKNLIDKLELERQAIWMDRPNDINLLKLRIGAHEQNLSIIIYAATDTAALVDYLASIRNTIINKKVDLETLANAVRISIEFWGSRYKRYFSMEVAPTLMAEAAQACKELKTIEELNTLVEAVKTYVCRLNYWIDLEIPWDYLTSVYEGRIK